MRERRDLLTQATVLYKCVCCQTKLRVCWLAIPRYPQTYSIHTPKHYWRTFLAERASLCTLVSHSLIQFRATNHHYQFFWCIVQPHPPSTQSSPPLVPGPGFLVYTPLGSREESVSIRKKVSVFFSFFLVFGIIGGTVIHTIRSRSRDVSPTQTRTYSNSPQPARSCHQPKLHFPS